MKSNFRISKKVIFNCLIFVGVVQFFSSCQGEAIVLDSVEPIHLSEDLIIDEGDSLIIKAGTTVVLDTGVNIMAYGDVFIRGTEQKPVVLKGSDPEYGWGKLWAKGECSNLNIRHAIIDNGEILSYKTNNLFKHVLFKNNKQLEWNEALARFWLGEILIDSCRFEGVNRGEGLLMHNVEKPVVSNCNFTKVPDAVEYIGCTKGKILNNTFLFMKDDAIDQNDCDGTIIQDNQIFYTKDCGMELGSEKFGSSKNLKIYNNLIVGCPKGIILKESSSAKIENSTFYKNDIAIEVETDTDSTRASEAVITSSVFFSNKLKDINLSGKSSVDFNHCITDSIQLEGKANVVSEIKFENLKEHNYNLILGKVPEIFEKTKVGYTPIQ